MYKKIILFVVIIISGLWHTSSMHATLPELCDSPYYHNTQQIAKSVAWTMSAIELNAPYVGKWPYYTN